MKEIVIKVECKGNFEETIKEIKDVLEKVAKEMKYKDKKVRWRAEEGVTYCFFDANGDVNFDKEYFHEIDNRRYNFGNYFKTKEEAEMVVAKVKKVLLEEEE